jgi:V8-like Glu-specific endopeptidase
MEISPGREGGTFPFGKLTSTRFSSVNRWVESEDPDFDIGCIHLEAEPPGSLGWFAVGALPPADLQGYLVNIAGYSADRGLGTELYHHKNRVLSVGDRRMFYHVDTYGGQSGAPVWIHESADSPPLAVGIHAYGAGGSPSGLVANSAPRILPEVLDQIIAWIEADGGWPAPA